MRTSDKALVFDGLTHPVGAHTLWILPTADKWQLIVNQPKQVNSEPTIVPQRIWADDGYVRSNSSVRWPTNIRVSIVPQPGGGILRIEFGAAKATAPFTVQE